MPVANEKEKQNLLFLLSKETSYNLSENHLWYSIFTRHNASRNHFTRVQRCISCLVLLYLSMLFSILYYNQQPKSTQFTFEQIIVGMIVELMALLPSLIIVQVFRRTRRRNDTVKTYGLPWWFLVINYTACFLIVSVSIFFIIARGIDFGDDTAQKWLISTASGFLSSILLTQPLKVNYSSLYKTGLDSSMPFFSLLGFSAHTICIIDLFENKR